MEAMAISRAGSSSPSSLDSGACAGMEATWGEEGPDRTTAPDLDPAGAGGTASWAAAVENRDGGGDGEIPTSRLPELGQRRRHSHCEPHLMTDLDPARARDDDDIEQGGVTKSIRRGKR